MQYYNLVASFHIIPTRPFDDNHSANRNFVNYYKIFHGSLNDNPLCVDIRFTRTPSWSHVRITCLVVQSITLNANSDRDFAVIAGDTAYNNVSFHFNNRTRRRRFPRCRTTRPDSGSSSTTYIFRYRKPTFPTARFGDAHVITIMILYWIIINSLRSATLYIYIYNMAVV